MSKIHPPETKAEALATAELFGPKAAAKATGVGERTIKEWRQEGKSEPEILELAQEIALAKKAEMMDAAGRILTKIVSQLEAKIDRLGQSEDPPTTGQIRDLSVAAGIWTDKLGQWAGWEAKAAKSRFSGGVGVQQNVVVGIRTDDLIARAKNVTPQIPEDKQKEGYSQTLENITNPTAC